jgi:hypothetical protein
LEKNRAQVNNSAQQESVKRALMKRVATGELANHRNTSGGFSMGREQAGLGCGVCDEWAGRRLAAGVGRLSAENTEL